MKQFHRKYSSSLHTNNNRQQHDSLNDCMEQNQQGDEPWKLRHHRSQWLSAEARRERWIPGSTRLPGSTGHRPARPSSAEDDLLLCFRLRLLSNTQSCASPSKRLKAVTQAQKCSACCHRRRYCVTKTSSPAFYPWKAKALAMKSDTKMLSKNNSWEWALCCAITTVPENGDKVLSLVRRARCENSAKKSFAANFI